MGAGNIQAGGGQFPGVQPFVNNAIGTENYLARGGGLNQANQAGQNILSQAQTYGNNLMSQQNPYLRQYYDAAALPMVQNYQNAVAPNILANAAQSGTVGGSGQQAAFGQAESNLGQGLATLGANIYEPAWAQSQSLAAGLYGQGLGAEANLAGQGMNLTQEALANVPNLAQAAYIPANQMTQAGALGQNQAQNVLNNAYQNLYNQGMWPYTELNMLGQGLQNFPNSGQQTTRLSGGGGMK